MTHPLLKPDERSNNSSVLRHNHLPTALTLHPHAGVAKGTAQVAFSPPALVDCDTAESVSDPLFLFRFGLTRFVGGRTLPRGPMSLSMSIEVNFRIAQPEFNSVDAWFATIDSRGCPNGNPRIKLTVLSIAQIAAMTAYQQ